jgi:hypothetical protein
MLPTHLGEGLGTLRWEVSGEGKLWDEDAGTLELRFGNRPTLDSRHNFVEYSQPDFRLTLGEQRFSLSPLIRGGSGLGLSTQGTVQLEPERKLDAHAVAYMGGDGGRFGVRVAAPLLAQTEASINVLTNPGKLNALLSGQLRIFPEISGLETFAFEGEYGLHLSNDASARYAANLSAEIAGGTDSLELSYRQTEAGFNGAASYSSRLWANGKVRLSDVSAVDVSARLRQEVQREANPSLLAEAERYNLQVGGTLSGDIGGADLSLKYDNYNEVRNAQGTSRQRNKVDVSAGLPLADGFYIHQSLAWQQELGGGASYGTLLYSAEADLPVSEGNARPQLALGYDLRGGTFNTFNVGVDYFGLITDTSDLYAGSGLYLADETFFYLIAGGSYGFKDGQALSFDASVFLFSTFEPLLELSLGYGFPLELPLDPLQRGAR